MLEWFNGNRFAYALYCDLKMVCHVWDDLVDKDKEVSEELLNHAFAVMLLSIPNNPFFVEHRALLAPNMRVAIVNFHAANLLEKGKSRKELEVSHYLRYTLGNVVAAMIDICFAGEHPEGIVALAWQTMIDEELETYVKEHQNETQTA